ncbi:MAG: hypothetical protein RJA59_2246 [Pseudomonadota bacterium]
MQDTPLLEARLADLADALARLEGRVAALEQAGPQARRSAAQAALNRSAAPARQGGGAFDGAQATRILSLGGRSLLVLAGAFVLRAVTEAGTIPAWLGVGLGFVYAGAWMFMADRAGKAGQTLSAAFHAVSVVIIGFPLLYEGATRFQLFPPAGAAALLAALTAAALLLATRRGLPSLAWVVSLGGMVTALFLMQKSGGNLVPGALYLVLLGVAALWIGYVRDWTGLRWPTALVADLVVLLVANPQAQRGAGGALLVQSALVALFLGSFATRTLYMGRKVVPFEMLQTAAVIAVGIGGAVWVAVRSGMGQAGFGVFAILFGAGAYAVAFAFVERRQKIRENFYFYTSVGIVLLLAGVALLLGEPARSLAWGALALGVAFQAPRKGSRTLAAHAAVYAIAAAIGSGLAGESVVTLFFRSDVGWRPGLPALAALLALGGCAWFTGRVPRSNVAEQVPAVLVDLVLALSLSGVAVAWLAPVVAGPGPAGAGALATLRTVVLVTVAVGAAWVGGRPAFAEAGWLAYPLLGFTGLKMLLEDLPRGRPVTLILGFACFGLALILVPRIRGRGRLARAAGPG